MRRVVPPANLSYKYARVYKDVVVLTVAGSLDLPARHLVPRLVLLTVLAVLLFVSALPAQAHPLPAEEDLPPTHVIADHVVISEVKTNGAGKNEFVELYNPTNQPVEMINWKLTSTAGATESDLANGFTGTIPAFGYFLIAPADEDGYDEAVQPDVRYTQSSNFLTAESSVLLYDNAGRLIDKIGWGSTSAMYETTAFISNPADTESLERRAFYFSTSLEMSTDHAFYGNSYDTDNNATDFILRNSPAPQNSSATERCCTNVAGTLKLQGRDDHSGVEVLMWPGSGLRATTGSSGHFSIPNVPAIASEDTVAYTVEATIPVYLSSRTSLNVTAQLVGDGLPATVAFQALRLLAGDINGDNRINIFDLAIIGSQYGGAGPQSDLNGDGVVNIQDLAIASGNFGKSSAGYDLW